MSDGATRPYDLLVFDWDGTIVDSISAIVGCTRVTLDEMDLAHVDDDTIRGAIGLGLRETVERFHPGCPEERYRDILETYRRHWIETYHARLGPFDGMAALLAGLETAGYLLAVATAKSRRGLQRDFDTTGLGPFFVASRTMDEAPSKPHPEMLESLLDELGVPPPRALMIGDTVHDLQMAANARMPAVGVLSGSQTAEQLATAGPVAVLCG
ncbi:MAG: HAD-IA family hydrolase [Thermoanaerobaculia bacterium]